MSLGEDQTGIQISQKPSLCTRLDPVTLALKLKGAKETSVSALR